MRTIFDCGIALNIGPNNMQTKQQSKILETAMQPNQTQIDMSENREFDGRELFNSEALYTIVNHELVLRVSNLERCILF